MSVIEIKNIGPISTASIPIPEGGGVVVLRGKNGSGKSIALDAVTTAISGKGKPQLKDLATKGSIQAGGVTLTVGRAVRRSGELEVATIDGRLSVADLVDPGIADPARADAMRIKALVGLSGAEIEQGDLYGFPEQLLGDLPLADPVAAMQELKKRLDIGARQYEKMAADADSAAKAILSAIGDCGDPPAVSPELVQERLTAAIRAVDALGWSLARAVEQENSCADARKTLAEMPPVDVGEAQEKSHAIERATAEKMAAAKRLKEEYEIALADYRASVVKRDAYAADLKAAIAQQELREGLEAMLQAAIEKPSQKEIDAADAELQAARDQQSATATWQALARQKEKADALAAECSEAEAEAAILRRQARQTEEVLSEIVSAINGCPLQVIDGRLFTATKRGTTAYADLSMGEKWRIALDIAIAAVGEHGLLVVPQEAWEGLDPQNRGAIAEQVKSAGVVIITAECADSALEAETLK